jgi:hypothetical protein
MLKRLAAIALLFGVFVAGAKTGPKGKTYTFIIGNKTDAGSVELKPGEYHLKLDGSQVVVTDQDGKQLNVTATVETSDHKFDMTSTLCSTGEGTNRLVSIELGGSTYKVVFQ